LASLWTTLGRVWDRSSNLVPRFGRPGGRLGGALGTVPATWCPALGVPGATSGAQFGALPEWNAAFKAPEFLEVFSGNAVGRSAARACFGRPLVVGRSVARAWGAWDCRAGGVCGSPGAPCSGTLAARWSGAPPLLRAAGRAGRWPSGHGRAGRRRPGARPVDRSRFDVRRRRARGEGRGAASQGAGQSLRGGALVV
jgi:hypothetical protein